MSDLRTFAGAPLALSPVGGGVAMNTRFHAMDVEGPDPRTLVRTLHSKSDRLKFFFEAKPSFPFTSVRC